MTRIPLVIVLLAAACASDDAGGGGTTACETAACSSDVSTSSSDSSEVTSSDVSTTEGTSTGGERPLFSELPPFGVLGARWVYAVELVESGDSFESVCEVTDVFVWPDGIDGGTVTCGSGGADRDTRYALYPDRTERREDTASVYEPPVDLYRVPLRGGESWQVSWNFPSLGTTTTEEWTVAGGESVSLPAGDFEAVRLSQNVTIDGQSFPAQVWWADGVGLIKTESDDLISELSSFSAG